MVVKVSLLMYAVIVCQLICGLVGLIYIER